MHAHCAREQVPVKTYGFEGSRNVTGVLAHEHFAESLRLVKANLAEMQPERRRIVRGIGPVTALTTANPW